MWRTYCTILEATVVLGVCTKYKLISLSKVPDFVTLKDFAYSFYQTLPWKPLYHHSCEFSCLLPVNDLQSNKTKAFNEAVHFTYRCNCPCLSCIVVPLIVKAYHGIYGIQVHRMTLWKIQIQWSVFKRNYRNTIKLIHFERIPLSLLLSFV